MNLRYLIAICCSIFFASFSISAQEQEKELSLEEKCEMEADRLERVLDLEAWQTFRVDSILKHDYAALTAEYEKLKMSKVENVSIYEAARDKWMEKIDQAYRKVFNDEQWAAYLKQGAAREQKARAKRMQPKESKKK